MGRRGALSARRREERRRTNWDMTREQEGDRTRYEQIHQTRANPGEFRGGRGRHNGRHEENVPSWSNRPRRGNEHSSNRPRRGNEHFSNRSSRGSEYFSRGGRDRYNGMNEEITPSGSNEHYSNRSTRGIEYISRGGRSLNGRYDEHFSNSYSRNTEHFSQTISDQAVKTSTAIKKIWQLVEVQTSHYEQRSSNTPQLPQPIIPNQPICSECNRNMN